MQGRIGSLKTRFEHPGRVVKKKKAGLSCKALSHKGVFPAAGLVIRS